MVKRLIYGIAFLLSFALQSCTFTPADYAQKVMNTTSNVEKQTTEIANAMKNKDFEGAKKALAKCQEQSSKAISELKEMGPYDKNSTLGQDKEFIDAAIDFVEFYDGLYKNEYTDYLNLISENKSINRSDMDSINLIKLGITNEYYFVKDELVRTFKTFCKNYELIISD